MSDRNEMMQNDRQNEKQKADPKEKQASLLNEKKDNKNPSEEKRRSKNNKDNKPQVDRRNKTLKRTAALSIVVLIAIVIALNVILNSLVGNKWQFDWTANKAATVGEVTEQILDENQKDVKITVLADRDSYASRFTAGDLSFMPKLLDEYQNKSHGKVEVEYINPISNPSVISKIDPNNVHQLTQGQIVVGNSDYSKIKILNYQDLVKIQQYYVTGYVAEEVLTGAIRFVTADVTPVVYLTEGHGEADVDRTFTILKMLLEQNNYLVKSFNSLTAEAVPDDAELLLMLSPKNDISADEEEIYMNFLKKGGSLAVLADYSTVEMRNLNSLLREFNLKLTSDRVRENDTERSFPNDPTAFVGDIADSKLYTKNNKSDFAVVFDARAVTTADSAQKWIKTEEVITTSDQAVRELGGNADELSPAGRQAVAMYSENSGYIDNVNVKKPAKVAVFGTSLLFSDSVLVNYMNSSGNYVLAYSSLFYMSNMAENTAETLLITPKQVVSYAISPKSQRTVQLLSLVFMGLLPLAMLITATVVYRRRKRL